MSSQGKVKRLPQALPSCDLEAEQAVLGAILLKPAIFDHFIDELTPEDFYREDHKRIYKMLMDLHEEGRPIDLVTVTSALKDAGKLEDVGGPLFLAQLSEQVGTALNAPHYAKIVSDHATIRNLERAAQTIQAACQRRPLDNVVDLLDWSEREIFRVAERKSPLKLLPIEELAASEYRAIEALWENDKPVGIPTGYYDLDNLTRGLQRSEMITLAGRPSMGKTALAGNIAYNVGRRGGVVAFFSLEMSKEQLMRRIFASVGKIEADRLKTGHLSPNEWDQLLGLVEALGRLKIFVDDKPAATLAEIRGASRRLAATEGLDLVIVDYLQLVRFTGQRLNREQEVAKISAGLKALAKELNIPVLVLAQLSRDCEKRPNKRPILSDLRESGAIEQDSDVVIFLYRDEVYNENSPNRGLCEVLLRKQRNGPTGNFSLTYQDKFTRFDNKTEERLF